MSYGIQAEFKAEQVWTALIALLVAQLPKVDIQAISDKDFNENAELIMVPPSVRVFFEGSVAKSTSDTQRLSYDVVDRFVILCADQDYTSPAKQAIASALLASKVLVQMAGTRILLTDGDISEPITWIETAPQPVKGVGVAYALAFEVPGLAQYPGANAQPIGGN